MSERFDPVVDSDMEKRQTTGTWRWVGNGVAFGLFIAIIDLTNWRRIVYLPVNDGLDLLLNVAHAFGSAFDGAMIFGIAGAVAGLFDRQ